MRGMLVMYMIIPSSLFELGLHQHYSRWKQGQLYYNMCPTQGSGCLAMAWVLFFMGSHWLWVLSRHEGLIWSLFLIGHLYVIATWQCSLLWTNTKKTRAMMKFITFYNQVNMFGGAPYTKKAILKSMGPCSWHHTYSVRTWNFRTKAWDKF